MATFAKLFAIAIVFSVPSLHAQNRGFERGGFQIPKVGSQLPVITVYDENGLEFSTKDLKGQYSVLVFGCLT